MAEERLQICRECPHFVKNKFCAKCGCIMALKARAKIARCPVGKW